MIGQIRRPGVAGAFCGRVADFGDRQPRRLVQVLLVDDLLAPVDGDRRRQVLAEKLALIVAHDHHGVRLYLPELASQNFDRAPALRVPIAADLDLYFVGEAWSTLLEQ